MNRRPFNQGMIDDAHKAAEALADSELSAELKRFGFTRASMRKLADRLTALHTRAQMARDDWHTAMAALHAEAESFTKRWSRYCNLVRGLTPDIALRNEHGVATPGLRKGSTLHRLPRLAKAIVANRTSNGSKKAPSSSNDGGTGTDGAP